MASRLRDAWPPLPLAPWIDTRDTLHMWLQIVGKVRLRQSAPINHSWHTTLYLTARGLTTSPMPHGDRLFGIDLDFIDHRLVVQADDGAVGGFPLEPMPVREFHGRLLEELARLHLPVRIHGRPNEVPDAIPFAEDDVHRAYDADAVQRCWRAMEQAARVFTIFRGRFVGKCSPVHLFWGALDLAVTRFSGREAPPHPGGIPNLPDAVTREAYSHEVSSAGFWPGTAPIDYPAFYAYAYPEPPGFPDAAVLPEGAFYTPDLREFVLPYDVVRASPDPDRTLLAFLESTYAASAELANWDVRLSR
jgi:hypothetical protein